MSAPAAAGKAARSKKRRQKHTNGAAAPAAVAQSSRWGWLARSGGAAPAAGKAARSKKRKKHSKGAAAPAAVAVQESRWRWLAYNGSAAAVGHSLLWAAADDPMAGAEFMGRAMTSLVPLGVTVAVVGGAYVGWKAGGLLKGLPGLAGLAARPAGALGVALWAQGTGPLITDGMAALAPWPVLLAPLAIAGAFGAVCWLYLERHATGWTAPLRWAARVPLATVVLSSLLYAPGALL
ncbi:hypothetical protein [Streptomyces sp. NBC_01565]|uniref:hypothetical protein n=1 Tax=Streptomyces sp. NBC_01565 TaxID=2975881 RepID=UPI002255186B|nr:hypothetical protein [Streptomyces sp. NBC_01565]MCX4547236.1 hypothetical protein [Streptomyces sp. NBC_01565]